MDPLDYNYSDEELAALKGSRAGRATAGGGSPGPGPAPIGGIGGIGSGFASPGVLGISPTEHRGIPILLRKRKGMPMIPGVTPGPPGKSDTVPAMLTPGEIVMNRGVTENPQLAQLLLALNQRGASNMQDGVGPVGMEYGGRAGYAYGGQVPEGYFLGGLARRVGRGISKGAKWLKKNTTLKNVGKVGLGVGALMAAPAAAGVLGKGLLASKGLFGSGAGLQVAQNLMGGGGGGGEADSAPAPAPASTSYQGVPMRSYGDQQSYGMAYGGFVPGFQQGGAVYPPDMQGMEQPGMEEQEGPDMEGPEGMEMEDEGMGGAYPSSAVRFLQLLLELDAMEREGLGGPEGHAYGGFAGGVPVQGFAKGGFVGWLKKRFKIRKPNVDPAGYAGQQQSDIAAARAAGYFDPMGNQALIRGQEEAARNTADALVRRQMTQASLGGMDPAQRAIAKQQALLQTGRGVQDIMATTRANALAAQDQFYKNMYGTAAQTAQSAQAAQANKPSALGQLAGAVAGGVLTNKLTGGGGSTTPPPGGGQTTTTEEKKPGNS
jgi:hypothetical protein